MGTDKKDPAIRRLKPDELDTAIQNESPLVVLYCADWCGYCKWFEPAFRKVAAARTDFKYAVGDLTDVDDSNPYWDRRGIEIIPTVVVYEKGQEVRRANGRAGAGLKEEDMKNLLGPQKP